MTEEQGNILIGKVQSFFDYFNNQSEKIITDAGIFHILKNVTFGEMLVSLMILIFTVLFVAKWIWEVQKSEW